MKKIVRMVFGSHMYGLNTPDSDMDYKGIYLPELDDLLLGTAAKHISHSTGDDSSKNSAEDVDDDWYSLSEFMKLAIKGETVALDMLHVNPELVTVEVDPDYGWIWDTLVARREEFYTRDLKAYIGYVKKQAAKYGVKGSRVAVLKEVLVACDEWMPGITTYFDHDEDGTEHEKQRPTLVSDMIEHGALPFGEHSEIITTAHPTIGWQTFYQVCGRKFQDSNAVPYFRDCVQQIYNGYGARAKKAEKNEGVDWKAVSHALRAGYQLRGILRDGTFSYPLAETEFLSQVKSGTLHYVNEVAPVLEALVDEIEVLNEESTLPAKVNRKVWDEFLLSIYKSVLINPLYGKPMIDLS